MTPDVGDAQSLSTDEMASRISALSRVAQFVVSASVVREHPLAGVGMLNVKEATGLRTIDNYYLLAVLESGLLSAVAFVSLGMLALQSAYRLRRYGRSKEADGLVFVCVSTAAMLAFVSLKIVMPVVFVSLGLAIAAAASEAPEQSLV